MGYPNKIPRGRSGRTRESKRSVTTQGSGGQDQSSVSPHQESGSSSLPLDAGCTKSPRVKTAGGGGGGHGKRAVVVGRLLNKTETRMRYLDTFLRQAEKPAFSRSRSLYVFKTDIKSLPLSDDDVRLADFYKYILGIPKYSPVSVLHKVVHFIKYAPASEQATEREPNEPTTMTTTTKDNDDNDSARVKEKDEEGPFNTTTTTTTTHDVGTNIKRTVSVDSAYSPVKYSRVSFVVTYRTRGDAIEVGKTMLEKETVFGGDQVYCKWATGVNFP